MATAKAPISDAALIAAARAGDRAAMGALAERHHGAVLRFATRACGDPERARDAAQDTLLTMLGHLDQLHDVAALRPWLLGIARRQCARARRRAHVRAELGDEPRLDAAPSDVPGPEVRALRGELQAALERALRELPPIYRDVVVLRDLEGLPAAEVGVALGIGERAVKSRLHRGRAALREALAAAERASTLAAAAPPRAACPDVVALLSRHLEGDLDASVCSRMEAHVAACPACAGRCDGLRRSLAACRALGQQPVPPPLRAALRRAVRELRLPATNS